MKVLLVAAKRRYRHVTKCSKICKKPISFVNPLTHVESWPLFVNALIVFCNARPDILPTRRELLCKNRWVGKRKQGIEMGKIGEYVANPAFPCSNFQNVVVRRLEDSANAEIPKKAICIYLTVDQGLQESYIRVTK